MQLGVEVEGREAFAANLLRTQVREHRGDRALEHRRREGIDCLVAVARGALVGVVDVDVIGDLHQRLRADQVQDPIVKVIVRCRRERAHDAQGRVAVKQRLLGVLERGRIDDVRPLHQLVVAAARIPAPCFAGVLEDDRRARGRGRIEATVVVGREGSLVFRGQEGGRVMVEPVLGAAMKVEVHHGKALAEAKLIPGQSAIEVDP
ncbi:MAG: hypothetical protein CMJ94_15250 [Planctomycetes bacterium]|nr:hypothetical protein [Planctomycetota bacterium]